MQVVSMDLNAVLQHAVETGASDIHFEVGQPPVLRSDGQLAPRWMVKLRTVVVSDAAGPTNVWARTASAFDESLASSR